MSFGNMADFVSLQSRKWITNFWVSKKLDNFSQKKNARLKIQFWKAHRRTLKKREIALKYFPNNNSLKVFLWTLWMLFWQTCGKTPTKVQNFPTKLPEKYIPFRNLLFSSKQSYGHVDAVLSKLVKRYWLNPHGF